MFPWVETKEQVFTAMADLRDAIAAENRRLFQVPSRGLSLGRTGTLQTSRCEGRLAKSSLAGLLSTLKIPVDFAANVCPQDLLMTLVNRLARERDTEVLVQVVDDVVTGVMPANRQPIGHDMLIDWIGVATPIKEATLAGQCLRIAIVAPEAEELLPGDAFSSGWELINGEDGWHSTEVWRFVVRLICSNGMVGFDKTAAFHRAYSSREPAMKSLARLEHVIGALAESPGLASAISWAAQRRLGSDHEPVVSYLAQRLEGDTTKLALSKVTSDTPWYGLLNALTSLARLHRVEMRRRYELEGGVLLNWFSRRGRTRPPWRRASCTGCENWDTASNAGEQEVHRVEQTEEPKLFD